MHTVLTAAGAIDAADLAVAASSGGGDVSTSAPPTLALAARIDLTVLDADGGEHGAALIAAAAALASARVPGVTVRDGAYVREEKQLDVDTTPRIAGLLRCLPAAATLALVGDAVVIDPDAAEAGLADALVAVAVGGDGVMVAADAPGVTTTAARDGATPTLIPPSILLAAAGAARARQQEALVAIHAGVK